MDFEKRYGVSASSYIMVALRRLSRGAWGGGDETDPADAWAKWAAGRPSLGAKSYKERMQHWSNGWTNREKVEFLHVGTGKVVDFYLEEDLELYAPIFANYVLEARKQEVGKERYIEAPRGLGLGTVRKQKSSNPTTKEENTMTKIYSETKDIAVNTVTNTVKGNAANSAVKALLRPVLIKVFIEKQGKPAFISKSKYQEKVGATVDSFMDSVWFDLVASMLIRTAAEFNVPGASKNLAKISQEAAFTKIALTLDFDSLLKQFGSTLANLEGDK